MVRKKAYICWIALLLMMSMVILSGCGAKEENPASSNEGETQQEEPIKYGGIDQISVGASSVGSSSYSKIATWSDFISTKLGINMTAEGTAGSNANAQLADAKEVEIGSTMVNIAREGYEGIGFSEGKKLSNLRLMVTMDSFALQFYATEKAGIKSFEDLAGKHINLSKAGSGTDTWTRRAFEDLKINIGKISNVSPTEGNELMRDGVVDASGCMGSIHPSILEMASTEKVNIFGTGDKTDEFLANWPDLNKVTMRANTYEGQTEPFVTVGEIGILVVHKDLPEDLVYDITKWTYEGKEEMMKGYPGFATLEPSDITSGLIPLHKGAYKYYQEIGIEIPDIIKPID